MYGIYGIFNTIRRGFTLVELLAVTALVALSVSGTALLLLRGSESLRVENAGYRLMLAMRSARIQAIQTGVTHRLVLDEETGRYVLVREQTEDDAAKGVGAEGLVSVRASSLPEGVRFERIAVLDETDEMQSQIRFEPDGSACTALIQIGNGTRHASILVTEATGRVRMEKGIVEQAALDWVDLDAYETI
jgi:prepilin-type N-terminal cleavage/methylation domain-containing protein